MSVVIKIKIARRICADDVKFLLSRDHEQRGALTGIDGSVMKEPTLRVLGWEKMIYPGTMV